MTPTQLRSFATVVRLGTVRAAAAELGVSEAAVSGNVGALRKELDDRLFHPSHNGLVFTPGGIRLAQRAVEMLGLQEQTRREVHDAHGGRRHLRIVASSLFAEYAAPGLIELFSTRADDLEVELVVDSSDRFDELLLSHTADVVIGPSSSTTLSGLTSTEFLRYGIVGVCSPQVAAGDLSRAQWHLGPSAVEPAGVTRTIVERMGVAEDNQRIYTSHAAALAKARNGRGVALVPKFVADRSTASSDELALIGDRRCAATGTWTARSWNGDRATNAARELMRFVTAPRAMQAMLAGSGARIGHFKPRVHITLWS